MSDPTSEPKKNKWWYWLIIPIVILFLLWIAYANGWILNKKSGNTLSFPADSTNQVVANQNSELIAAYGNITALKDSLRIYKSALNICMGVTTVTKTVTTIQTTGKAKVAAKTTPNKTYTTPRAINTPVATTPQRIIVPADSPSRSSTNNALCGDQYMGIYPGSHGVTINDDSKLVFYQSDAEMNSGEGKLVLPAPLLNGESPSQEFYWDNNLKLWIFESNIFITIDRLLDVDHKYGPIRWNVYLGRNAQWNYTMYVPHEILKTGSASAKTALANGEVELKNPAKMEDGADWVSYINYKKR